MTAGHVLVERPPEECSFDQGDVPNEEDDEDEGFYSGEEEYELDDILDGFEEAQDLATIGDATGTALQNTQLGLLWPSIGSVSATSNKGAKTEHDLDWALINLDRVADYRPNLLVALDCEDTAARHRPLKENRKATEDGSSRKVLLLSGTGGVKSGTLSTSLSFLMMGPGKAFTKTYTLVLPHSSGKNPLVELMLVCQLITIVLNAGDCGSWVVDESTCEVYGHVVASDAMGDTYVVPLNATLRDMEEKLAAAAVVLPTEADIHTWLAQHAKAAEQTAVPIASKKKKVIVSDSGTERVELPGDLQKVVGPSSSRASASLLPPAVEASTPIVDYCSSCDAKFEGNSQDVRSRLLRHRQSCSKQRKHPTSGIESPISQNSKDSLDESSKSSSMKHSRNLQQKATSHPSTQQPSPVPWSIRSMYSSFRKPSGHNPQQKDKGKVKSVSSSGKEKTAGSTSSTKRVATTSSTSTSKDSKKNAKDSSPRKDWPSPPSSTKFPNPSPALAGSIGGDGSSGQASNPRPSSLPPATPKSWAPSPPRPAFPPVNGHKSSHQSSSDPRHQSHTINSGDVSYEGYTFTRCKPLHRGQKETWAVAQMVPMPVSQTDLKDQIKKGRNKHVSGVVEYHDDKMKGCKRKQVDNLIRERKKIDGPYGYEYVPAFIKLDSRKTKSKDTETLSMQVILKRQAIAGFLHEIPSQPSLDVHPRLLSQVMDLTREDELGMLREHGGRSQNVGHWGANVPFSGHPEHGAFPMAPGPGQSFGHSVPFVDNRPPFIVSPPLRPESIYQEPPPSPHSLGMSHSPLPPPPPQRPILMSAPLPPEPIYQQPPPSPYSIPLIHQAVTSDQRRLGTAKKFNQKKAPKIVYNGHNLRIEHGFASNSSNSSSLSDHSIGPYSDNSWAKTDETPASTVNSSKSYESRNEKNVRKESRGGSHNKDKFIPTPLAHEPERVVYREDRRKEYRRSSLSPIRGPRDLSLDPFDPDFDRHDRRAAYRRNSSDARYHDFGPYEIEPAVSFPTDRSSRHRRSSVSPERMSHRRVSSFDSDHPHAHSSRALIPTYRRATVYQEPRRGFRYDYAAERRRELGRWDREWLEQEERARMRREREKERLVERHERQTREKKRETERQEDLESIREMKSMKEMERKKEMESMKRMERMKEMESMKRMERMKDRERRERAFIERAQRTGMTYDDDDLPRYHRYPGYYD